MSEAIVFFVNVDLIFFQSCGSPPCFKARLPWCRHWNILSIWEGDQLLEGFWGWVVPRWHILCLCRESVIRCSRPIWLIILMNSLFHYVLINMLKNQIVILLQLHLLLLLYERLLFFVVSGCCVILKLKEFGFLRLEQEILLQRVVLLEWW